MSIFEHQCQIAAPVEQVFAVISHPDKFSAAVPHIKSIEYLSEVKTGVGARFKETRLIKGREATSTLEVTEFSPNQSIRLVSDEGGTQWISDLTTVASGEGCVLTLKMEARAYKMLARIFNRFFKGMIANAIKDDLESIKAYCEKQAI